MLLESWTAGLRREEAALFVTYHALVRGQDVLASLSKNARALDGWALLVALGSIIRLQLMRALGLSRAGAWFVADQLACAELVRIETSGFIVRIEPLMSPAVELIRKSGDVVGAVDEALAKIDQLLVRSTIRSS